VHPQTIHSRAVDRALLAERGLRFVPSGPLL